jgi:predicted nucleic acid-binding protein
MSNVVVVLDACVLYPASLRDTLLRAASAGLYRVQLTDEILEEVQRNLFKKGMKEAKAERLIRAIKEHFSDAFVAQHRLIIISMTNHVKDRHVLAAAVVSRAQVIVTQNLRDFPDASLTPFEIEAQSPDDFLVHSYYLDREAMAKIVVEQATDLCNPSKTTPELLHTLAQHAPNFVSILQEEFDFGAYSADLKKGAS